MYELRSGDSVSNIVVIIVSIKYVFYIYDADTLKHVNSRRKHNMQYA